MNLVKIIIKIERTRRNLYNEGYKGNPEKLLKISRKLDLLMNEYFKLKGELTLIQESCCSEINNGTSRMYSEPLGSTQAHRPYSLDQQISQA